MKNFLKGIFFAYIIAKITRPFRVGISRGLESALGNPHASQALSQTISGAVVKAINTKLYPKDSLTPEVGVEVFDSLLFPSVEEARDVIEGLRERIKKGRFASVADLLELSGQTPSFSDYQFGWGRLGKVEIQAIPGDGFKIALPKPTPRYHHFRTSDPLFRDYRRS